MTQWHIISMLLKASETENILKAVGKKKEFYIENKIKINNSSLIFRRMKDKKHDTERKKTCQPSIHYW